MDCLHYRLHFQFRIAYSVKPRDRFAARPQWSCRYDGENLKIASVLIDVYDL